MLRKVLLPISYLVLAAILIGSTIVLVAISRGYGYDFRHNSVIHNGLVVLGSYPNGATVKVNNKIIKKQKTPYRSTLEARDYQFEVTKDGYRPWSKRLTIRPSGVTWAQYILLFPNEFKPQPLLSATGVTALFSTKDRRHLAYQTIGTDAGLWLLSADDRSTNKLYTPKVATPEAPAEVVDSVVWSDDGSHILFRSTLGDKVSYQLIATNAGAQPINLTEQFGFSFSDIKFNPNNWRELYWNSPEGLRRLDVESRAATLLVPGQVQGFTFAGDRVIYVTTTPLGKSVLSLDRSGHKQELVQSLAESDSYQMLYSGFQGQNYLAVLPDKTNTVTLYSDIYSANPVAKVVSKAASAISFNDDGRYLAFYLTADFGSYDIEHDELVGPIKFSGTPSYVGWFDNYHLLINTSGKLILTEYDGANTTVLDEVAAPMGAAFGSSDSRRIFWLGQGTTKDQIVTLDLKR